LHSINNNNSKNFKLIFIKYLFIKSFIKKGYKIYKINGDWGLGIGGWGLGGGGRDPKPQTPNPNTQTPTPQSPIPNPQSPYKK
jgi:hypothetical protein